MTYRIFDSLDRPCSTEADHPDHLWADLTALQHEEEEEPLGLTYAIGKVLPDGSVTYEY